jgi:putative ATP-dependent endonuclease of the OLD family
MNVRDEMIMNSLKIQNFKGLKNVEIPLSSMVCIIGKNNSGKSSTLLALYYFLKGESISEKYYYDKSKPISIEVEIIDIKDEDLLRLSEEHRKKLINEIEDNKIKLVRKYMNGSTKLCLKKLVPKDPRFYPKNIKEVLKGKSGKNVQIVIQDHLNEYKKDFEGITTQKEVNKIISSIINEMDINEKIEKERPLPSGIPNSITKFLPDPILISAVKDLTDDAKPKSSSTFGKIIKALLDLIDDKDINEIVTALNKLEKFLNKIENDDGTVSDKDRLKQLKELEGITNSFLEDNFPDTSVEINVSPPTLEELFSSSKILINDGIKGDIETKGDGLKRAVIFTLLRTYNVIRKDSSKKNRPYLFLFEEPELYLHPASQKILFEALCNLARHNNQVVTTTHSPIFFTLDYTGIFVKMKRINDVEKPFSTAFYINVEEDMDENDLIKIISFENNNAAFFSDKILLVEGDSDLYFFKHVSKVLNEEWDFDTKNIPIIRLHGKGNARRYKEFFDKFQIDVHMILDIDVLIKDFDKLNVSEDVKVQRKNLLDEISVIIAKEGLDGSPKTRNDVDKTIGKITFREKYERVKEITETVNSANFITAEQARDFEDFYSYIISQDKNRAAKTVLKSGEYDLKLKNDLLDSLREQNIYVLSKGELEDYYPDEIKGNKFSKALKACELLSSKEKILETCPIIDSEGKTELEIIFEHIFK